MVFTLYESPAVHRNSKPQMQVKKLTVRLPIFSSLLYVLKSQRADDLLHCQCWSVAQRDWGWARNKPQLSGLCRYWINWTCSFIPNVQRLHNVPGQLYSWGVLQFNPAPNPPAINPTASRHYRGSDPWFWRQTDWWKWTSGTFSVRGI